MLDNYTGDTLKDTLQLLGGVVVRSFDLETGEVFEPAGVGLVGSVPLSICTYGHAQNSTKQAEPARVPFVEWRQGASILKVSKAEPTKAVGGGLRGNIKGFTGAARNRMMNWFAGIILSAKLPVFVTLTYPETFPEPKQSKKHLKRFIQRLKRAFPLAGGIWKLEPQLRGAPHYHLLVWGSTEKNLRAWVPEAWHEIAGGGDIKHLLFHEGKFNNKHCVEQVRFRTGMMNYASKYIGKTFEVVGWDSKAVGKFWGIFNPKNIPIGELKSEPITYGGAVEGIRTIKKSINSQRHGKAKRIKNRSYPSLSIRTKYGNEQWIEKVFKIEGDKK